MATVDFTANSLVLSVIENEPRIDSRIVAAELGVAHEAAQRLVDKYSAKFEELGILRFEIGEIKGRGQPEKFYLLNEDQTYFLMTLVRNTAQAVELKKRLVQAFAECRKRLAQPTQTFDLATMTSSALRELAAKVEECAALNARIITLQPKADFYDHVAGNEANYSRDDAAKILRTGPKRLWKALREWRIVQASGMPYQKYFDSGYFRLVPVLVHKGQHSIPYNQTMITGKGLTWIKALMDSQVMPGRELVVA
ncbi:MAG: phage regulatory protein/antirepressor Ant [Anaerolineales bacterium]|nr:phage regulatory protein/antirepressor Ant [Anaerolineales bacterium]